MVEDKSAPERKQHREATLVGRDKASTETIKYLNQLRDRIQDAAAAEAVAMLHAQVNGDHPDYTRPPKKEPFGHWHADLVAADPTVVSTATDGATVDVSLSTIEFVDGGVDVFARFAEQSTATDATTVETATKTLSDTTATATFSTSALEPGTDYTVKAVAEATSGVQTLTDVSSPVTFSTDQP